MWHKDLSDIFKRVLRLEKSAVRYDSDLTCCQINSFEQGDYATDDDLFVVKDVDGKCLLKSLSTNCCYHEVTRSEAVDLVDGSLLEVNALYKITDRGDNGIFLLAISENRFQEEGVRLMLIPNDIYWANNCTKSENYGIYTILTWKSYDTYPLGYKIAYYGHVYESLEEGNIGNNPLTEIDKWQKIYKDDFNDFEYCEKQFGIIYDFDNDWISKQWDEHGNIFGIDYSQSNRYPDNPVNISDWVLGEIKLQNETVMRDNKCDGVFGNTTYSGWDGGGVSIVNNNVKGAIQDNAGFFKISNNLIVGKLFGMGNSDPSIGIAYNAAQFIQIENNVGVYSIHDNSTYVEMYIQDNTNTGSIEYNNSTGSNLYITGNKNLGNISTNLSDIINYNSNSGSIYNNYCPYDGNNRGGVIKNSNLGDIGQNWMSGEDYFGEIKNNSNNGDIILNGDYDGEGNLGSCEYITNNNNNGHIIYNFTGAFQGIEFNSNNGDIASNNSPINSIYIGYNSNNGSIANNSVLDSIYNNSNTGGIDYNSGTHDIEFGLLGVRSIYNNSNLGNISGNSNGDDANIGYIRYNSNGGQIENNSNIGWINSNSNGGGISQNSNQGNIESNANNGYIYLNSSVGSCNIYSNVNNGYISGVKVADVTDAILNK